MILNCNRKSICKKTKKSSDFAKMSRSAILHMIIYKMGDVEQEKIM